MTLYRKSVVLRDFDIHKDRYNISLKEGLEVAWKQSDNKECYATFIHNDKEEINNKLSELNIASDRVRTLKEIPKFRVINTVKERIQ
jgi:hypothetical protein